MLGYGNGLHPRFCYLAWHAEEVAVPVAEVEVGFGILSGVSVRPVSEELWREVGGDAYIAVIALRVLGEHFGSFPGHTCVAAFPKHNLAARCIGMWTGVGGANGAPDAFSIDA